MERVLYRTFQEAGLPSLRMRIDVPVGDEPAIRRWVYALFSSLRPRMDAAALSDGVLGDLGSLLTRLDAELATTKSFAACIGLVGAWSRKPGSARLRVNDRQAGRTARASSAAGAAPSLPE
jgi:hypothetical protein